MSVRSHEMEGRQERGHVEETAKKRTPSRGGLVAKLLAVARSFGRPPPHEPQAHQPNNERDAQHHAADRDAICEPAPAGLTRNEVLLSQVPKNGLILEIGPSYGPVAPKADGWNTLTLDHMTQQDLINKYTGHAVDLGRIEKVDFVWASGPLSDAVPSGLHGNFDAFIASHVVEHTPDLLAFLDSAEVLLKREGVVVLAIPDKRYCFDYFQPLTTTGQILEAHAERRHRHTRRLAFDHYAYLVHDGGAGAWGQHPLRALDLPYPLEEARRLFDAFESGSDYIDLHAWRFSPSSFELLLLELARLGETDWLVDSITEARGCEFYAWLRRGGKEVAKALSAEDLAQKRLLLLRRMLLETREQIDFMIAGEENSSTQHH